MRKRRCVWLAWDTFDAKAPGNQRFKWRGPRLAPFPPSHFISYIELNLAGLSTFMKTAVNTLKLKTPKLTKSPPGHPIFTIALLCCSGNMYSSTPANILPFFRISPPLLSIPHHSDACPAHILHLHLYIHALFIPTIYLLYPSIYILYLA